MLTFIHPEEYGSDFSAWHVLRGGNHFVAVTSRGSQMKYFVDVSPRGMRAAHPKSVQHTSRLHWIPILWFRSMTKDNPGKHPIVGLKLQGLGTRVLRAAPVLEFCFKCLVICWECLSRRGLGLSGCFPGSALLLPRRIKPIHMAMIKIARA